MKNFEEKVQEIYNTFEVLGEEKEESLDFLNDEQLKIVEHLKYTYFRKGFLACLMIKK